MMNLTPEARNARRQFFLGPKPSAQVAAVFDQFDETVPQEQRGIRAAATGDDLEINCLDVIGYDFWSGGGITTKSFKAVLDAYPNAKRIRVVINSPGGIADEGIAIYNCLKRHKAKITTEVLSIAASAASVIFMAGTAREMNVGTRLMIHRAMGCCCGNDGDMDRYAEELRAYDASILSIYSEHVTAISREEIKAMVDAETYMSEEEALGHGFATKLLKSAKAPEAVPETPEEKMPDEEDDGYAKAKASAVPLPIPPPPKPQARTRARSPMAELSGSRT